MRQLHSKKKSAIFCLFARGGADMQKDKGSKIGWANKQKETLDIGVSKKSAGVIRLPRLNCYQIMLLFTRVPDVGEIAEI